MILSLLRFFALGLVLMTGAYLVIRLYLASTLREGMEEEWAASPAAERHPDRDAWVETRMRELTGAIRLRAFLLAYVVPAVAGIAILISVNAN